MQLRYAPTLTFVADTSFDEAHHIEEILRSEKVARDLKAAARRPNAKRTMARTKGESRSRLAHSRQAAGTNVDEGAGDRAAAFEREQGGARGDARSAGERRAAACVRRGDENGSLSGRGAKDLSLHRAVGRGNDDRRCRRTDHARERGAALLGTDIGGASRLRRRDHADAARRSRRSRWTASGPTIWRAKARRWSSRPRIAHIHRIEVVELADADHCSLRDGVRQRDLCARLCKGFGPGVGLLRSCAGADPAWRSGRFC